MLPKDIRISDIVQFTIARETAGMTEYRIVAAIITNTHDNEGVVSLHVFLPLGGWMDVQNIEPSTFPAGEREAVGKWSWPTG